MTYQVSLFSADEFVKCDQFYENSILSDLIGGKIWLNLLVVTTSKIDI